MRSGMDYRLKQFNTRMEALNKTPLTCWDGSIFVPGEVRESAEVAQDTQRPSK